MPGFQHKPTQKGQWYVGSRKATVRFGARPLNPGGHGWGAYAPTPELQSKNGVETYACTVFAILKALITLSNFLGYALPKNCSERFNAVLADINPPGANPHDVAESIRRWGVLIEDALPFDEDVKSIVDFYHPKPMDEGLIAEAKKIVQQYELGHEYVFNDAPFGARTPNKPALLKAALERGPVCASVFAWRRRGDRYYKEPTDEDEHWTFITDFVEGKYWVISDQYEPFEKRLDWNYDFQTAEVYFLQCNPSGIAPNDRSYFLVVLRRLSEALKRLALTVQQSVSPAIPRETPVERPQQTVPPTIPENEPAPKYDFTTPKTAYYSVRVLCDEAGLTVAQKNLICACIYQESEFKNGAVGKNAGSTDWGICQINDYWHIGQGKDFPTVQYVIDHPEEAVRYMIRMFKAGRLDMWVSYSSGAYAKWLSTGSPMWALRG